MAPDQGSRQLIEARDAAQIERVVGVVRDVLGESVVGAYLHGSAILGGLRPTSDLDVLAVVRRPTMEDERRRLIQGVMPISGPPEADTAFRPVELTVAVGSDVKPWRYPPLMQLQYGEWLKPDYERGFVPEPTVNPDLAPLITMTLDGGRTLIGPPPDDVLDRPPEDDLRAAIVEGIPGLMADLESDTRNVLLTLARIWSTLGTGELRSKGDAAEWAAARLAGVPRDVLLLARDQYLVGTHGKWRSQLPDARAATDAMQRAIVLACA